MLRFYRSMLMFGGRSCLGCLICHCDRIRVLSFQCHACVCVFFIGWWGCAQNHSSQLMQFTCTCARAHVHANTNMHMDRRTFAHCVKMHACEYACACLCWFLALGAPESCSRFALGLSVVCCEWILHEFVHLQQKMSCFV